MEKKISKSKIILISIAILFAILTFSIGIFGICKVDKKKEKPGQAAEHTYLMKAEEYYETTWNDLQFRVRNHVGVLEYQVHVGYWSNVLTINYTGGHYYNEQTNIGGYDILHYYDITNITLTKCTVEGNAGLAMFHLFKSKGVTPIPCRHIRDGLFDNSNTKTHTRPSLETYYLNGAIDINDGNYEYTLTGTDSRVYSNTLGTILRFDNNKVEILRPEGLKAFALVMNNFTECENVKNFNKANVILSPIENETTFDMKNVTNMIPIGTRDNPFKGTFNGNGYTVSGLTKPLFEYTSSAKIENIYLKGCSSGSYSLLVNNATDTEIKSIFIHDSSIITSTTYSAGVGSLIAIASGKTTINNCGVNAYITNNCGAYNLGCFIGDNEGTAEINNSYFRGKVKHKSRLHVYFGCLAGGYTGSVSASNNIVSITGGYVYVDEMENAHGTHYGELKAYLISANVTKNYINRVYIEDSVTYSEYYYEFPSYKLRTGVLNDYLGAEDTDLLG